MDLCVRIAHDTAGFPSSGHQMPQEEEIRHLKREIELLRQERDILKKAIGIFDQGVHRSGTLQDKRPNHPFSSIWNVFITLSDYIRRYSMSARLLLNKQVRHSELISNFGDSFFSGQVRPTLLSILPP